MRVLWQTFGLSPHALEMTNQLAITSPPVETLKIGVCRTHYWDRALPATCGALEEAVRRFTAAGAVVEECEWNPSRRLSE